MSLFAKIDQLHAEARQNRWLWYFSVFCRFALAAGFIPAGLVKIMGERFASGLAVNHPMGHYLEALHHTGYYYTFIGIAQLIAAILLIIPRTVLLGAMLYFPIIVNIWVLSFAVRFDGSFVTSPLMLLANLYLLAWHYDRLKYLLPFKSFPPQTVLPKPTVYTRAFPFRFFAAVGASAVLLLTFFILGHEVMPRNSQTDCEKQFVNTPNEVAGLAFCTCIHTQGQDLDTCLEAFEKVKK